jgi:glycosyltransferase involved in cell wall biosynthesis
MMLSQEHLYGKRIVCHVPSEPFRYLTLPDHRHAVAMVGRWITRSSQAAEQLRTVSLPTDMIPFLIDMNTFRPLAETDEGAQALAARWNIPQDKYLIGSFQRDSEGSDLQRPKLVKGPDVFLEIVSGLIKLGLDIHVVLAGPRRYWLRKRLEQKGVPFTYVGLAIDGDDMHVNSLPRSTLNALYNVVDLSVVASRSEGGPHAILEAAAARCKVISTPVGMARDVLEESCIFTYAHEAVEIIRTDILDDSLAPTKYPHYRRVYANHRPESVKHLFKAMYGKLDSIPAFHPPGVRSKGQSPGAKNRRAERDSTMGSDLPILAVGLWHSFFKPPYGGGNQFMMALRKGLSRLGVTVRQNEFAQEINAYVLNSIHFDVDLFLRYQREHRLNVIHRIDGPIYLIRGFDREKDELCFSLNERFASATVLQSTWTYQRIVEMGYNPVSPVIIHNSVDSDIFHSQGRIPFDPKRKVRLISTSWSNNPRKGGPIYKWMDTHLDWDRFQYTFVGNVSEDFEHIRRIPPVPSEELAEILRCHDIYVTASRNDPCSNALIEALACGLPALYMNDGGHPELVGMGGLPFTNEQEILAQLNILVDNYETFQNLIVVPTLESVAGKYLALIKDVIQ